MKIVTKYLSAILIFNIIFWFFHSAFAQPCIVCNVNPQPDPTSFFYLTKYEKDTLEALYQNIDFMDDVQRSAVIKALLNTIIIQSKKLGIPTHKTVPQLEMDISNILYTPEIKDLE